MRRARPATTEPANSSRSRQEGVPRERIGRRAIVGAIFGALLVAGAASMRDRHGGSVPAAPPLDIPHVEGATIRYSSAFADRAGISATAAIEAPLAPVVNAVGTIELDPQHVAAVGTKLNGLVTGVARFEGDPVESGTVLATVESPELGAAQAAVLTLEAQKQAADSNSRRESALLEHHLSTAREAEAAAVEAERYRSGLQAARQRVVSLVGGVRATRRLGAQALRSPLKGIVVERNVTAGQGVEHDLVAFRVADIEHLWVVLDVFEKSLVRVHAGDKVDLTPLAEPKQHYEARVARVGPAIDPRTRSAPVRVEIVNRAHRLRVGQAVRARIYTSPAAGRKVTVVPTASVTLFDNKPTVFRKIGEHAVVAVPIDLGYSNGPETEIRRGIAPGDEVVSSGVFALKSELFR